MESNKIVVHSPYVPPHPPNPSGRRYTIKELLHLGDNLPYIFCYVSAFKTSAFEYGVFRPGVSKDKSRRPRANSMTCNTKGIPRPSFNGEDYSTQEQIIAASKTFEEEEFKKMLSDDALKAWNSGPARLAHPRSGDKALAAFKSLPNTAIKNGNLPPKTAASVSVGEPLPPLNATAPPRKASTARDVSPNSLRMPTSQPIHNTSQLGQMGQMSQMGGPMGQIGQIGHAPRTKSIGGQSMTMNDPLSAHMARNAANMNRLNSLADNNLAGLYGSGAPPIAALMDPRALSGLFGRQSMGYVRPDPYSQAHFYAPTSLTPNQYAQAAMGMMDDVQWMAVNSMAGAQQQAMPSGRDMGVPTNIQTTGATYPNVPYQAWYLRELDREAERLTLGLARQTQEDNRQSSRGRRM